MRNLFLIFGTSVLFSGVSVAQTWDKEDIDIFVKSCKLEAQNYFTEEGALEYCNCSTEKIMRLYPNSEDVEKMTNEELNAIAEECLAEILEEEKDIFLKWTEDSKIAFVEGCEEELEGSGIDGKIYCPCALGEILLLYKTPFEATDMTEDILYQIAEKCIGE